MWNIFFDHNGPLGLRLDMYLNLASEAAGLLMGTLLLGYAAYIAQTVHLAIRSARIRKSIGTAVWRNIISITSHELVLDAEGGPRALQMHRDLTAMDSYLNVHLDLIPIHALEDFLAFRSAIQQISVELSRYGEAPDARREIIRKLMRQLEKEGAQRNHAPSEWIGPFLYRMFDRLQHAFGKPTAEILNRYPTGGRLANA